MTRDVILFVSNDTPLSLQSRLFHFSLGVVGDWKNLFTEAQNQEMDAKFKACLEGTKLGAKLKYDVYCKA